MQSCFIVEEIFDAETCRRIQAAMDAGAPEPAAVLHDAVDVELEARRALDVEVNDEVLALVESHLDARRDAIAAFYGVTLRRREGAGFLRYAAGGFYGPHVDRADVPSWPDAASRAITVVVFLNSSCEHDPRGEFSGGRLRLFPDGVDAKGMDVVPSAGTLIAFPASIPHEVAPVTAGCRDTVVDWFS